MNAENFTLEDMRKKVAATRQRLEEEETALRVMERMSQEPQVTLQAGIRQAGIRRTPLLPIDPNGKINLEELNIPSSAPKKSTLIDDIQAVIERFDDQEFTINHLYAVLKQTGKGSDAKHFKNRLSMSIRKLTDDGILVRTFKGSGNTPHRYRVAQKQPANSAFDFGIKSAEKS